MGAVLCPRSNVLSPRFLACGSRSSVLRSLFVARSSRSSVLGLLFAARGSGLATRVVRSPPPPPCAFAALSWLRSLALNFVVVRRQQLVHLGTRHIRKVARNRAVERPHCAADLQSTFHAPFQIAAEESPGKGIPRADGIHHRHLSYARRPVDPVGDRKGTFRS